MGGGVLLLAQDKYQPKYLRQDDKAFKDLTIQTTDNGWIEFKKAARVNPTTFFKDFAANLGLDKDYNFKLLKDETDKFYTRHQRFLLYYKNIAVEGVEFTLHSSVEGILTLAHGRIPEGLDTDISKPMPEPKALDLALANMKVTLDDLKKMDRKKPIGELLLARLSDNVVKANFKLCYVFDVYGNETLNAFKVYVDATTGEITKKTPLFRSCFGHGKSKVPVEKSDVENRKEKIEPIPIITAIVASTFNPNYARYGQNLDFETDPNPANNTQFRLSAFNNALNTRMAVGNTTDWALLPDVTNNNGSNWTVNFASRNAQTAHWLTQRMHHFLNQATNINRNGLNGQGLYPRVVTDWAAPNAQWRVNLNAMRFGELNNASLVTADVVGHEYTHGINENTANLAYEAESGALDEGIADIFGTALERNILPNGWNWVLGEDAQTLRNMADPPALGQPQVYNGPGWFAINPPCIFDNDFCGVHINSGVLNRWFHNIVTGNRLGGQSAQGMDFEKALAIVYKALTVYLQSSSGYQEMKLGTLYAARDLYGLCSFEYNVVKFAWGEANLPTNTNECTNFCDFNISASSFNSNPACGSAFTLNANCSGANCGGVSYTWTGQGGVRNGQQVSYNAPNSNGSYTYTVTASRTGCSNKTANVTVNVNNCGGGGGGNCASGNFAGFFDDANCTTFSGWALDQNNFGRTVDVEIRIDGQLVATVQANGSRPDLIGAFGNNPQAEYHGWSYPVPATASWRNGQNHTASARICGANSNLWSDKTVNCTGGSNCNPPNPPNISANPSSINSGGSSTLTATGCDGGTVSWSNGASGNSVSVNPSATTNYTATCSQNNCTSGNSNTATVTVNSGGGGNCSSGNFNGFFDEANCTTFSGWALDQNNFGRTVDVEIRIDGQLVATVQANGSRPDLIGAFGNNPQAEYHGWSYTVPPTASWRNGTNRNASARICGATSDLNNSPKTINCTGGTGGGGGSGCNFSLSGSVSNANPSCGVSVTLNASCSGADCGGVAYSWSGNGIYQASQSTTINVPSANGSFTYSATGSKSGCSNQNTNVSVNVSGCGGGGGSSACSPENIQCSGNQYETRDYVVSASNSGNYTTTVFYRSHEGAGQIRWQVNGGAVQTMNVAQTSINDYPQITLGSASLNAGNNTITLSSGALFLCFKQVCIQSGARIGLDETVQPDNNELVISPNPTNGILNLKLWLSEASAVNVEVQDLTGRGVKAQSFGQQTGQFNETINLSDLPSGMYLLQLRTDKRSFAKKLMVVR